MSHYLDISSVGIEFKTEIINKVNNNHRNLIH